MDDILHVILIINLKLLNVHSAYLYTKQYVKLITVEPTKIELLTFVSCKNYNLVQLVVFESCYKI